MSRPARPVSVQSRAGMSASNTAVAPARLVALHADVDGAERVLDALVTVIGRLPEACDVVIRRPTVSRIHARIERHGSHYALVNLSRNDTFVNGQRLADVHILCHGDALGFANPEPVLRFMDTDQTVVAAPSRLRYDDRRMSFSLDGRPLELTPNQFRLLQHLHRNVGRVCTREDCARAVWGDDFLPGMDADNLDKLVSALRKQFTQIDPSTDFVQSRRGIGFVLAAS